MSNSETPQQQFERLHVRPAAGRTLIVGSRIYDGREDRRARYPQALGFDMLDGPGVDRVINLEEPLPSGIGNFAHIECWSVLEHSRRPWLLAANLQRMLRPGGTIHLSVPFIWRPHGYPNDYWRFTRESIPILFPRMAWSEIAYAHTKLRRCGRPPVVDVGGVPHFERCEVLGFGVLGS